MMSKRRTNRGPFLVAFAAPKQDSLFGRLVQPPKPGGKSLAAPPTVLTECYAPKLDIMGGGVIFYTPTRMRQEGESVSEEAAEHKSCLNRTHVGRRERGFLVEQRSGAFPTQWLAGKKSRPGQKLGNSQAAEDTDHLTYLGWQ